MFLSKKGIRLICDMPVCLPDCVVHASSEYYQRISKRDYICRLANFLQICPPREKLCFDKPCGAGWNRFKGCWGLPSGAEESTHGTVPGRPLSAGTLCSPKTPTTPVSTEPAREQGLLPRNNKDFLLLKHIGNPIVGLFGIKTDVLYDNI